MDAFCKHAASSSLPVTVGDDYNKALLINGICHGISLDLRVTVLNNTSQEAKLLSLEINFELVLREQCEWC
jgi:hypothetical protein